MVVAIHPQTVFESVNTKTHRGRGFEVGWPRGQARREGGGGKFSPTPATFGAPPSLKNTENGVPDGFFLT